MSCPKKSSMKVSKEFKDYLKANGKKGESYEDIASRLIKSKKRVGG